MAIFQSMRTWKDFHWDTCISASSLLLWNDFSLYWVDFSLYRIDFRCVSKSTSVCVETTLYWNKRTPFKSIPDCIAHMMRCTLGSIEHGGRVTWKNVIASYIIVGLSKKLLYFWELEQGKTLSKWIVIGKAMVVHLFQYSLNLIHCR